MINQQQQRYKILPASSGFMWVKNGTELLRDNFGRWLILLVLYLGLLLFSTMNLFTSLLFNLFNPVFWGGIFMAGLASLAKLEWSASILFDPLKKKAADLFRLGGILTFFNYLVLMMTVSHLSTLMDFDALAVAFAEVAKTKDTGPIIEFFADPRLLQEVLLTILIAMLVSLPVMMAGWFAPVLILEKELSPLRALKLSFQACSSNFMAFLVYGLVTMLMMMFVVMSLYIALLFVGPLFLASYYCSYEDIFPGEESSNTEDNESNSTFVV